MINNHRIGTELIIGVKLSLTIFLHRDLLGHVLAGQEPTPSHWVQALPRLYFLEVKFEGVANTKKLEDILCFERVII